MDGRHFDHPTVFEATLEPDSRALKITETSGDAYLYNWDHVVCFGVRSAE